MRFTTVTKVRQHTVHSEKKSVGVTMRLNDVSNVAPLEVVRDGEFHSLGTLSHQMKNMLVCLYDKEYLPCVLENQNISCVITNKNWHRYIPDRMGIAITDDPQAVFYKIHEHLLSKTSFYWEDFESEVSPTADTNDRAFIATKNVRVGSGTVIEPNVSILERSIIGKDVTIRAGTVIGGEGFEPKWVNDEHIIVKHAGGVKIHDRVEIQGNCHVARSIFGGFTEIGENTKVDALVHIAHNVRIGRGCEIAACAMLAGSAVIGDNVWIGPSASITSEVRIGDNADITIGAVVTQNVPPRQKVSGNFAIDHARFLDQLRKIR